MVELCRNARHQASISLRDIASILGNLTWDIKAIPYTQAQYRSLQSQNIKGCKQSDDSLDSTIVLDSQGQFGLVDRQRREYQWKTNVGVRNGPCYILGCFSLPLSASL
jgi:hypothetical protein